MKIKEKIKKITKRLINKKTKQVVEPTISLELSKKISDIENLYDKFFLTNDFDSLNNCILLFLKEKKFPNKYDFLLRNINKKDTILDYIIENNFKINDDISVLIASDIDLLYIYLKHKNKNYDIVSFCSKEMLLYNDDNFFVLDYIIENDLYKIDTICKIDSKIIIDILSKYNKKDLLKYSCEKVLLMNIENDETVIEYLIKNNYAIKETIGKINSPLVYDLLIKYSKKSLLKYLNENVLCTRRFRKTILEEVLDKNILPSINLITNEIFVKILIKRGELGVLKYASCDIVSKKIPGTKVTLFEYLLKKDIICKEAINAIKNKSNNYEEFLRILKKYNIDI